MVFSIAACYLSDSFKLYFLKMISNGDALEKFCSGMGLNSLALREVRGGWKGYDPKITIYEVVARLNSGALISIERLDLRLDSLGTILERSPMFSTAEIDGLSVFYEVSSKSDFSFGSSDLMRFPMITSR